MGVYMVRNRRFGFAGSIAFLVALLFGAFPVAPAAAAAPTEETANRFPAHEATGILVSANLRLDFNINVALNNLPSGVITLASSGNPLISIPTSDAQVTTVDGDGGGPLTTNRVVINPTSDLAACTTYAVSVSNTAIYDASKGSPAPTDFFAGISAPNWVFTTAGCTPSVQGVGAIGALVGTYGIGQTIPIAVCFPGNVTVTNGGSNNNIKLRLNSLPSDGSGDISYSGTQVDCGVTGSTRGLRFNYTVAATDTSVVAPTSLQATRLLLSNSAQLAVVGSDTALTAASTTISAGAGTLPNYFVDKKIGRAHV